MHQEIVTTITVRHKNIVQFLGYCSHTEKEVIEIEGKFIMAEIRERLLCFEYISNGSLDKYLTGTECHLSSCVSLYFSLFTFNKNAKRGADCTNQTDPSFASLFFLLLMSSEGMTVQIEMTHPFTPYRI